jgi:hypothetical protein
VAVALVIAGLTLSASGGSSASPPKAQSVVSHPTDLQGFGAYVKVACRSDTDCFASGVTANLSSVYYRFNGSWKKTTPPGPLRQKDFFVSAISCWNKVDCSYAGDGVAFSTQSGWSSSAPPGLITPIGVSCLHLQASSLFAGVYCVAVDEQGDASVYVNGQWSSLDRVDPYGTNYGDNQEVNGVACGLSYTSYAPLCFGYDNSGHIFEISGRQTIRPVELTSLSDSLVGGSCGESTCVLLDSQGNSYFFSEGGWTSRESPKVSAISCSLESTVCLGATKDGVVSSTNGGTWQLDVRGDTAWRTSPPNSIACVARRCVAANANNTLFSVRLPSKTTQN